MQNPNQSQQSLGTAQAACCSRTTYQSPQTTPSDQVVWLKAVLHYSLTPRPSEAAAAVSDQTKELLPFREAPEWGSAPWCAHGCDLAVHNRNTRVTTPCVPWLAEFRGNATQTQEIQKSGLSGILKLLQLLDYLTSNGAAFPNTIQMPRSAELLGRGKRWWKAQWKQAPPWLGPSSTTVLHHCAALRASLQQAGDPPQSRGYHTPQLPNALLHQHHCVTIKMLELALE